MHIDPSGQPFDPAASDVASGVYVACLVGITEVGPSERYPDSGDRLVFEFQIYDPSLASLVNLRPVYICTKKVFRHRQTGKLSNLCALAEQAGVHEPWKGFDPDVMLDKYYIVQVYRDDASRRSYVRRVRPCGYPPKTTEAARIAWVSAQKRLIPDTPVPNPEVATEGYPTDENPPF